MTECYVANLDAVAQEAFEEETVLINFERGTYFSLRDSAPAIWGMIQSPATLDHMLAALAAAHGGLPPEAPAAVTGMLDRLREDGCVLTVDADNPGLPACPASTSGIFAPPVVQAFHDLEELITIDPVHDTNELIGWPVKPPSYAVEDVTGS
jgi:hypothetical protein